MVVFYPGFSACSSTATIEDVIGKWKYIKSVSLFFQVIKFRVSLYKMHAETVNLAAIVDLRELDASLKLCVVFV